MEVLIWHAFAERNTEKALSLMTPEIAKNGMVCGYDLFSMFLNVPPKENPLFAQQLNGLRAMGYRFNVRSKHGFKPLQLNNGKFFRLCMRFIHAYERSDILAMLFADLNRTQLEPFFAMHTMPKSQEFLEFYPKEEAEKHFKSYLAMQTAREKVRKAAIVLIGVADRNTKAVLRIIARVVWSMRGDEEWME